MPYTRLIPVVLLKHGLLVRSQSCRVHQVIGNPISTIHRYSSWDLDELVLLDISRDSDFHDLRRGDLQIDYKGDTFLHVISEISKVCCMPFTVGGKIQTIDDIARRLEHGADKCSINTAALDNPKFISDAAKRFGSQCIVLAIDAKREEDGQITLWKKGATEKADISLTDWAKQAEDLGAGEIFLNSIDCDGIGEGYDNDLIAQAVDAVNIPVIACGGVGEYEHFGETVKNTNVSAVAAANIFHFREVSYPHAKKVCEETGINIRPFDAENKWFKREPEYNYKVRDERIAKTIAFHTPFKSKAAKKNLQYCTKCVAPSTSATPLEYNQEGVCTACQMSEKKREITKNEWQIRKDKLARLLDQYRSKDSSTYDCIIPVSGGKDSYFQTHYLKNEMGMNPLLITYNVNNWLPIGWENMLRMKEVFGVDHHLYSPSIQLLKKLNRLGFIIMGDMNWHAHIGMNTVPFRAGIQFGVPLVFYGEHGYLELGGQFSQKDFPEFSYRYRLEHSGRGYEWNYFVGLEGITEKEMNPWKYPSDKEILDLDLRGMYLGNYIYWEANEHGNMVADKYGFKGSDKPFDRTYRTMSNLDDMHENGLHDYLKYIKFGYGRCTDHVCKDIRAGIMTREEGIEMVRKYDHVKPSDMKRWSEYTGISEEEFDRIADSFRDSRVWWRDNGVWKKHNIWD